MVRKFTNITCIYHDDKNYIPAQFNCPDLTIDDVLLKLTTNEEFNYEKIASMIVDYAFALYCHNNDVKDFSSNPLKYNRANWKLLSFKDSTIKQDTAPIDKPITSRTNSTTPKK